MPETPDQEAYCPLRSALDGTHQSCVKTCKLLLPDGRCSFVAFLQSLPTPSQAGLTQRMREEVETMVQQALAESLRDMNRAIGLMPPG